MNYSRLVAFHITECRHLLLEEYEQKSQPERQNDPRGVILVGCPRGLVEESGKYSLPFPIYNQLVHLITRQVTMPLLSVAGRNPKWLALVCIIALDDTFYDYVYHDRWHDIPLYNPLISPQRSLWIIRRVAIHRI